MDYEKKYNEALERARAYFENENYTEMADVFPELAESEDERIRKKCIAIISNWIDENDRRDCIAYLEKQKEQKPKFYPGDVIKCTSTGSLWVRCKGGDNIRSDGHTACIGGGFELASEEETMQFFYELTENGYQWDCIKGRPMKKEQKPAERSDALEIDTIRDWSMRFAPDIREEIVATAYHFYNLRSK